MYNQFNLQPASATYAARNT